jgi:hypothetical protein
MQNTQKSICDLCAAGCWLLAAERAAGGWGRSGWGRAWACWCWRSTGYRGPRAPKKPRSHNHKSQVYVCIYIYQVPEAPVSVRTPVSVYLYLYCRAQSSPMLQSSNTKRKPKASSSANAKLPERPKRRAARKSGDNRERLPAGDLRVCTRCKPQAAHLRKKRETQNALGLLFLLAARLSAPSDSPQRLNPNPASGDRTQPLPLATPATATSLSPHQSTTLISACCTSPGSYTYIGKKNKHRSAACTPRRKAISYQGLQRRRHSNRSSVCAATHAWFKPCTLERAATRPPVSVIFPTCMARAPKRCQLKFGLFFARAAPDPSPIHVRSSHLPASHFGEERVEAGKQRGRAGHLLPAA